MTTQTTHATPTATPRTADEVAEQVLGDVVGAMGALSLYVGSALGWYDALADGGATTPAELAGRTGTQERYAREWLEMQAASGLVQIVPDAGGRRFALGPGAAEALTDETSLAYVGPLGGFIAAVAAQLPHLLERYRDGGGVGWAEFGDIARVTQAALNRPWFERMLGSALAGVPDVHDALDRPGARIVDVGCGGGWSTIALARAYPAATVEGVDIDGPSIEMARRNLSGTDVADRVTFRTGDAADLGAGYDAAFAFECVHDMPYPVEVLASMRRAVGPDGVVVVMDEAVADELTGGADVVEQLMYGFSMFVCLPDGLSWEGSAGTGTVMRPAVLGGYAREAGFGGVEVLDIADFSFFRFYRLLP